MGYKEIALERESVYNRITKRGTIETYIKKDV